MCSAVSVDLGVGKIEAWQETLSGLHARFAARFARSEPRARALTYMAGLIAPLERKNGWTLAERAGEGHPIGMQRLLGEADWDFGTDGAAASMFRVHRNGGGAART